MGAWGGKLAKGRRFLTSPDQDIFCLFWDSRFERKHAKILSFNLKIYRSLNLVRIRTWFSERDSLKIEREQACFRISKKIAVSFPGKPFSSNKRKRSTVHSYQCNANRIRRNMVVKCHKLIRGGMTRRGIYHSRLRSNTIKIYKEKLLGKRS